MFAVGIGTVWLGYSVFYYGITQVQSGNWGFLDLTLPSRIATLADVARDNGATSTPPSSEVKPPPKSVLHGLKWIFPTGVLGRNGGNL